MSRSHLADLTTCTSSMPVSAARVNSASVLGDSTGEYVDQASLRRAHTLRALVSTEQQSLHCHPHEET